MAGRTLIIPKAVAGLLLAAFFTETGMAKTHRVKLGDTVRTGDGLTFWFAGWEDGGPGSPAYAVFAVRGGSGETTLQLPGIEPAYHRGHILRFKSVDSRAEDHPGVIEILDRAEATAPWQPGKHHQLALGEGVADGRALSVRFTGFVTTGDSPYVEVQTSLDGTSPQPRLMRFQPGKSAAINLSERLGDYALTVHSLTVPPADPMAASVTVSVKAPAKTQGKASLGAEFLLPQRAAATLGDGLVIRNEGVSRAYLADGGEEQFLGLTLTTSGRRHDMSIRIEGNPDISGTHGTAKAAGYTVELRQITDLNGFETARLIVRKP